MITNDGPLRSVRGIAAATRVAVPTLPSGVTTSAAGAAPQSSALQLISLAQEVSGQPPPIDMARIAELRRAIAAGDYAIDPMATAQAMMGRAHDQSVP